MRGMSGQVIRQMGSTIIPTAGILPIHQQYTFLLRSRCEDDLDGYTNENASSETTDITVTSMTNAS